MGNLSLQLMNSNICTLWFGLGVKGGLYVGGFLRCIICGVQVQLDTYILVDTMCMGVAMRVWCSYCFVVVGVMVFFRTFSLALFATLTMLSSQFCVFNGIFYDKFYIHNHPRWDFNFTWVLYANIYLSWSWYWYFSSFYNNMLYYTKTISTWSLVIFFMPREVFTSHIMS